MANLSKNPLSRTIAVIIAGLAVIPAELSAQPAEAEPTLEEVVVTGSRGRPRTVSDSPVPIDVFDADTIESVSFTDTNDVLKTLVPSYNVSRNPISDGGTFIRPASLRGMPTDKTLVLVNSKRRHRAALVSIGGSGTQGPDIATIPTIALKNVEVLRDGAAAQYGSDAIAGVINFILKDSAEGASFSVDTGEYYEGDGSQFTVQGNIGLPLANSGFINLSAEVSQSDATIRAEQYCETWFCLDPSNPVYDPTASYTRYTEDPGYMAAVADMGEVVQPWGQPNSDAQRFFVNAEMPLSTTATLYGFGNYSSSETDGPFFYRYPGNGTIEELRRQDGSIYTPLEKFPGGFTPRFFGDVFDFSIVGGLRGELSNGLMYDLSGRTAESKVEYTLNNTINPSLGPDSPTSFKPGDLVNQETQFQADFSLDVDVGLDAPALLAFGASYLDETYKIVEGEPVSYEAGPYAVPDPWGFCNDNGTATSAGLAVIANGSSLNCASSSDPVYRVVGVGSNGFPGYSPEFSDNYERDSYAFYTDISADLTDALFMQAAVRYEDYSDFGSEVVGKLAGRYSLTEAIGVRASVGTGFRAPTPGQQGTTNVSTRLPDGFPVATGLFPAGGVVAQALGATPLRPETSTNFAIGLTAEFDALSFTADFYRIDVDDRVYSVSTRPVSTNPTAGAAYDNYLALANASVVGAETIGGVFYFTNAFDTKTQGLDLVATLPVSWDSGANTTFSASLNFNTSEFASDPSTFLNEENQFDFENFDPSWRGMMSARHTVGPLTLVARANLYGSYENFNGGQVQEFDPAVIFDLEGQYQINETLRLTLGGRNLFDYYPEKDSIGDYCCGRLYSSGTAVSWQGGYYYARLNASF
ncbi:TonB-dependent receptor [Pseudohongiella sp. SYSU M77423]|uniref:TonB-dependent receptor plug domain-containing protein n=1 Tax=unclassified Pseudohongiella TaxID=2629611 RepID=UPI000C8C7DEC|nr:MULTISPECIES: TonB-dependent receptor [unclassified Pseudohongiella]MAO39790.1 TonB-dependent receptor [Pseudohongiella sp.]MDH7942299.1 TonB-dependent receptor [Pseudohongiella sp. SYSU M77423]MEC8859515.1 TonB-dependent receptor [Pseudomonadota bacterium]HBX38122.1 TonB-dependent receptor [Pseudohongiella sp.]|tara:strand:+ start:1339 stop:3939 length:2601 start_codon:yes stop_codon:yes gene_type:complete